MQMNELQLHAYGTVLWNRNMYVALQLHYRTHYAYGTSVIGFLHAYGTIIAQLHACMALSEPK